MECKKCQKRKNRRIQLVHWPGLGPAAISGQSKTATNTISASNLCLQAEKELAEESARFADLCQYFERQRMDVPVEILDQLGRASRLADTGANRSDEEAKPEINGVPE